MKNILFSIIFLSLFFSSSFGNKVMAESHSRVNSYAMLYDIMVEDVSKWHSFFQTDITNTYDATLFINTAGKIGCGTTGYTSEQVIFNNQRARVVINAYLADEQTIYEFWVNGIKKLSSTAKITPDNSRFSLGEKFFFFSDNDGDDNDIEVANLILFNQYLSAEEIQTLGDVNTPLLDSDNAEKIAGYWTFDDGNNPAKALKGNDLVLFGTHTIIPGNESVKIGRGSYYECTHGITPNGPVIIPVEFDILPYLQAPTPNSVIINWHTPNNKTTPQVFYGTSKDALNQSVTGSNETNVDRIWNTVKLTGLQPDTEYFYQCKSGDKQSEIFAFRTFMQSGKAKKVRIIIASDSQDDEVITTRIVNRFTEVMKEKFGEDLHNHINLFCHTGDLVSGGGVIEQYENRYFRPFSPLTHAIPAVITPGNHEVEHAIYYRYVKYDDFANGVPGVNQESFYTLDVNGVQILMLNSNTQLRLQSQLDWLNNQLARSKDDDNTGFSLAFCHHVYYSELWPGGSGYGLTQDTYQGTPYVGKIIDVLQQYPKVPVLFNGHVHGYERHVLPGLSGSGRDFMEIVQSGAGGILQRWGMSSAGPDIYESKVALDQYHLVLLELDLENNEFEGNMYSFGNSDRPLDCVISDTFYGKLNQPAPEKPSVTSFTKNIVICSDFEGTDSLMTVHLQIADNVSFSKPRYDKMLDKINIYGTDKNFVPVNLNAGIDLKNIDISKAGLTTTDSYYVRVRYRDNNLKWSEWSTPFSGQASGISQIDNAGSDLNIFHSENNIHISSNKFEPGGIRMYLYNMFGVCLYNIHEQVLPETNQFTIPTSKLPGGIYSLVVENRKDRKFAKVVIR